jgi:hypothetical protein
MGLVIEKDIAAEVPPPGLGLKTVTLADPPAATSLPEMDARNRFPFSKVVGRSAPFQRTTELEIKPDPATDRVNPALPATAEDGSINPMDGTGFGAVIVNDTEFEVPPPGLGLTTVTLADPAEATSLAGIDAVN